MSRRLTMSAEEEREYRSLGRFPAAQKAFAELDAERAAHDATSKELDEARAHVERLREALEGMRVAYHNLWDRCVSSGAFVRVGNVHDLSALKVCQAALAATPAQGLAELAATRKDLAEARARLERLREVLTGVEWAGGEYGHDCPSCCAEHSWPQGHNPGCALAAALAATPAQSLAASEASDAARQADVERRVIERCAKVADGYASLGHSRNPMSGDGPCPFGPQIAAAIRALAPEVTP